MYSILASCCLPLKGAVVWRQNNPYVTEPPHSTSLPTSLSRQHQPFWCACPVGVCHSNGPYPSAQETPRDWQEYYIISSGHFDKIFELNWSNSPTPSSQHTQIHRGTSPCVTLRACLGSFSPLPLMHIKVSLRLEQTGVFYHLPFLLNHPPHPLPSTTSYFSPPSQSFEVSQLWQGDRSQIFAYYHKCWLLMKLQHLMEEKIFLPPARPFCSLPLFCWCC